MTPLELTRYLDTELSHTDLRRLDQSQLHRLEGLLHHWYVMAGDVRRSKVKLNAPLNRDPRPINAPEPFRLDTRPARAVPAAHDADDEHATWPGAA